MLEAIALGVAVGCGGQGAAVSSGPEDSIERDLAAARASVTSFFEAVERADCETMRALLAESPPSERCRELLDSWRGRKIDRILETKVDGRDPDAVIVRTRLTDRGHPREILIRAERSDARWRVRF